MIKVISFKPKPKIPFKCTCDECGSVLEYEEQDIRTISSAWVGISNDTFIICPVCGNKISHRS